MREPHRLRVTAPAEAFAPLARALAAEAMRLGWLELTDRRPAPPPEGHLPAALDLGVLRAVAVGPGLAVVAKPLRGEPVLRDLLREHFRGCRLVLVSGAGAPTDLPAIEPAGADGFRVVAPGVAARVFTAAELASRLRRPRPWDAAPAG